MLVRQQSATGAGATLQKYEVFNRGIRWVSQIETPQV